MVVVVEPVYRNDSAAKLGDLRTGDRVHVSQSSEGTTVFAADAQHQRGGPDPWPSRAR